MHLTTTHRPDDPRISLKECRSLADAGYEVMLLAPACPGASAPPGVTYLPFYQPAGRLARIVEGLPKGFAEAVHARPALVHVHDPELMALAPACLLLGIPLVFDAHEDFAADVQRRSGTSPSWPIRTAARLVRVAERFTGMCASAVIGVHTAFGDRFRARRYVTLRNFPLPSREAPLSYRERTIRALYTGGLATDRFADTLEAAGRLISDDGSQGITVAGLASDPRLVQAWNEVPWGRYAGHLDRAGLDGMLSQTRIGMALLPETERRAALSTTKVYEYLAHGIPVVATKIPAWFNEFGENPAFRWISSNDAASIADAIRGLDSEDAWQNASSAANALGESKTWAAEEPHLIALYDALLGVA